MLPTQVGGNRLEFFSGSAGNKNPVAISASTKLIGKTSDTPTIMLGKQYAILRLAKTSFKQLQAVENHNERKVQPMNADAARRNWNVDYLQDERSLNERWCARMAECGHPKVRKNAVPAIEAMLTFSPEAADRIDPHQWGRDCGEFIAHHFGKQNIVSLVLHLDEKTPHCSAVIVPLISKSPAGQHAKYRLCASHWLDGPDKLHELQDSFWSEVGKKYGLDRGEIGSTRKHVPQTRLYQNSNQIQTVITDAVQSIPDAQPSDSPEAHKQKIEAHLRERLAAMAEAARAGALAQQASQAAAAAERKRKEESDRRIEAEKERDCALQELDRIRRENQSRLRDLPVSRVLEKLTGISPVMEGNQRVFQGPNYKLVVAADDWRFNFFRGGKPGGSGAISAVMQVLDLEFRDALRWMAAHFSVGEMEPSLRATYEARTQQSVRAAIAQPATTAEKMTKYAPIIAANWAQVRAYLTEVRGLRAGWIDALHSKGHIWANHYQSACFAHRDDQGTTVGVSVRGIASDYKQTVGDKNAGFFRFALGHEPASQMAIVESPIEALSLASLERARGVMYASSAGAGGLDPLLHYAAQHGLQVLAAQNHDVAGEVMAQLTADQCRERSLKCVRVQPPAKDWNETLLNLTRELKRVLQNSPLITKRLRGIWRRTVYAQGNATFTLPENALNPTQSPQENQSILHL